jgi:hypothetical protein
MTPGTRFAHLTVLELLPGSDGTLVRVRCDCGVRKTVRARHLRAGLIKSCGCRVAELNRIAKLQFWARRRLA